MIRIRDLILQPGAPEQELLPAAAKALKIRPSEVQSLRIVRRSIDARRKRDIRMVYTVDVSLKGSERQVLRKAANSHASLAEYRPYRLPEVQKIPVHRPVIVGFGPAGMFAALILAEMGLNPLVLERGCDTEARRQLVEKFWATGELSEKSNVQFGAGGAGMFSDGKLNTGISDYRIRYVLEQLVRFGAKEDILYDAKPHVGTDILRTVVSNLCGYVRSKGGEIRFETQLTGLRIENNALASVTAQSNGQSEEIPCDALILAIGHSARDTFRMLLGAQIPMEPKPFSMGVRVEHPQSLINSAQYGENNKNLPAADYKLSCHLPDGSSAYTFCMCPGGYVVAAASQKNTVVTNGMSYSGRDGSNANSALLVTLKPEDFPYEGTLGGVIWQEELERRAFTAGGGNYYAPAQLVGDFLANRPSTAFGSVQPTYCPGVTLCNLSTVMPERISNTLRQAIPMLDGYLHGFALPDAVLTALETRSSSPVRILRDENCQSAIKGIFPCGEGAGYAGGIMSAAIDGIRCAEALLTI